MSALSLAKMARSLPPQPFPLEAFKRALVFVPHPDDEVLGCGGLLRRLSDCGKVVEVVLVSDGSGGPDHPINLSTDRLREFVRALQILGIATYEMWHLPDGCLERVPDLNERIDRRIAQSSADLIVAPWQCDLHPDHAAIGAAVTVSSAAVQRTVAWFEVWSPLPASHLLDITDVIEIKKHALSAHATSLRYGNYLQAMLGLSAYRSISLPFRGKQSYAEAYLLRHSVLINSEKS
jgi:LmbE family N-acetylglucosaminyl deacetylase